MKTTVQATAKVIYDWTCDNMFRDPADVRNMMLKHDLKRTDAKTREYRDYFWGAWDAYRVKVAVGRDSVLTPKQQGAPLNTFGNPYAEVGGKVLDWLDPKTLKYTITYRKGTLKN